MAPRKVDEGIQGKKERDKEKEERKKESDARKKNSFDGGPLSL
jgi:hypothetical protein